MSIRWQVRISKGFGIGTHTFRTKFGAVSFLVQWRKASYQNDADAELLRNGKPVNIDGLRAAS